MDNLPLHLAYSLWPPQLMHVKSKGGLAAVMNERIRALVAPSEMHGLFHKFSGVIMPHQVRKMASEWIIHGVAMDGHVLTEIHAACYRTKSTHTESQSEFGVDNQDTALHPSPAEYFAVLGHYTFKKLSENLFFPL